MNRANAMGGGEAQYLAIELLKRNNARTMQVLYLLSQFYEFSNQYATRKQSFSLTSQTSETILHMICVMSDIFLKHIFWTFTKNYKITSSQIKSSYVHTGRLKLVHVWCQNRWAPAAPVRMQIPNHVDLQKRVC